MMNGPEDDPKIETADPMEDAVRDRELDPGISDEDFSAIMRGFVPETSSETPAPAPAEPSAPREEVTGVDDESKKPLPPDPDPEPEAPPAPSIDPGMQTLLAELAELKAQLAAVAAQPAATAPKEAEPDPYQATTRDYAFAMPVELVEALSDEDAGKRSQALTILVARAGELIHNRVIERVGKMFDDRIVKREEAISSARRADEISRDFYNAHPDLNKPELAPVVNVVAAQVYKETGAKEWSAEVRDSIATRVRLVVGRQGVEETPSATQRQSSPPALVTTRGRGPAPAALPPEAALIANTFDM